MSAWSSVQENTAFNDGGVVFARTASSLIVEDGGSIHSNNAGFFGGVVFALLTSEVLVSSGSSICWQ